MNIRSFLSIALVIAVACNLAACKKKKNDNPFGNQRIALLDLTNHGVVYHYHFVYDNYNNVDSIVYIGDGTAAGSSGFLAFNYFGSSYSITDQANYSFDVYANTAGQILKILRSDTLIMNYTGNQLGSIDEKIQTFTPPYYTTTTTSYKWNDGDVTSSERSGTTTTWEYDLSKNGQPGDAARIGTFLMYGRSIIKTKRLPKDQKINGNMTEQFLYQFDGSGRISQLKDIRYNAGIPPTSDTLTYNYTYY